MLTIIQLCGKIVSGWMRYNPNGGDKVDQKSLKQHIDDKGLKIKYLAKELGLSYESTCRKVRGESDFKATEIGIVANILELTNDDICSIFFT